MEISLFSLQTTGPKAGTAVAIQPSSPAGGAPSAAPQQASPPGGGLMMLLPLLIMVPFLLLTFRRQKKEQEARGKLKKGDKVVSQSGLIGELVEMDEKIAKVKIAPGITVQMVASTLSAVDATPAKKDEDDVKDAKLATDKK